jgi:hypothetical protein
VSEESRASAVWPTRICSFARNAPNGASESANWNRVESGECREPIRQSDRVGDIGAVEMAAFPTEGALMRFRRLLSTAAVLTALSAAGLLGFTSIASAQSDWVTLSVSGSGEQEVPAGSGEDGAKVTGSFQLNTDGELNYTVSVSGNSETITAGHIHRGAKGENGDVVVTLDNDAINDGTSATVEIDPGLAERIINNPENWYLNVHSDSFQPPSGVARGQLTGDPDKPDVINTGTGGQAADDGWAGTSVAVCGALVLLTSGGALFMRRRADRAR